MDCFINQFSGCHSAESAGRYFEKKRKEEAEKQLLINNSNKQVELMYGKIDALNQQLKEIKEEKNKLQELYELKNKESEENKKGLKKSKIYNIIMLGISVASLIATILLAVL